MRNVMRSKMNIMYWWTHWFWITVLIDMCTSASPVPLSSYETISTSLKSVLIKNDNAFQQTVDQSKMPESSKSVPPTFKIGDPDNYFGDIIEVDAEKSAKIKNWHEKLSDDVKPTLVHVMLEKDIDEPGELLVSSSPPKTVNVTSNSSSQMATTILTSFTEPTAVERVTKSTTTTQTTKLTKVDEIVRSVKFLDFTNSDVTEANQNDPNDTVKVSMVDEANDTEATEATERKSKSLIGVSEEVKEVNNRSTLQNNQLSQSSPTNDQSLFSEALFDTDEDNGGITMSAGIISVICVGIIGSLSAFSIMFVYVYRRRFLNKPQTLSEPDSSGYIDESSIRDNSDELYSLDNDSFLNSLEAMTIQNYWTDSVKHTKL